MQESAQHLTALIYLKLSLLRFCTCKLVNPFCYIKSTLEQVWFYAHHLIIEPILTHCGPEVIFNMQKCRKWAFPFAISYPNHLLNAQRTTVRASEQRSDSPQQPNPEMAASSDCFQSRGSNVNELASASYQMEFGNKCIHVHSRAVQAHFKKPRLKS